MALVLDTEWRLVYPGCDLTFGSRKQPIFNRTTPDYGDYEVRSSDGDRPRADGRDFGVDFFGGRTIAFDLGVLGSSETAVRSSTATLAKAWRADAVRSTPGAVAELHSRYRGLERVVYGRPRRFSTDLSGAATQTLATAIADFECADNVFYGADVSTTSVSLVPTSTDGGLVAPLRAPLLTTASSNRSTSFTVTSDLPVWPVITISGGQVARPVVEVVGLWRLELMTTLAYDRSVVIDTRPWRRSILMDGGASLAGVLSRSSTRLRNAAIPAGTYRLSFSAGSTDRTATATVQWQNAYSTP